MNVIALVGPSGTGKSHHALVVAHENKADAIIDDGILIKDGKINRPVRGATLIGRGADVLMRIDRVGPRMWMAQGMCGSLSGSIPTNVGQPRIRVSQITVGGKGGAL